MFAVASDALAAPVLSSEEVHEGHEAVAAADYGASRLISSIQRQHFFRIKVKVQTSLSAARAGVSNRA
jgi:hypothetical protein